MKNKICVYAICKNESKFVEQWLNSMQEADYIVVLDTGSTDDTVEKLQADPRVTRVEQQVISPWRFDVARNESMKLVPDDANILVCTDFDEKFEPGWGSILRQAWGEDTTRIFYTYAWSHNEVGDPTDIFTYDKIHTRDYKWVFPVHEVLMPVDDNFEQKAVNVGDKIYLHHFQDKTKARGSYFDLLKQSVEENPGDCHVRMLLAREYLIRDQKDEALEEYLGVLRMPDVEEPNKKLVLLESLGRVADLYDEKEMYDEAIWYCQEFIKEDYTYREPYLIMAEIYNKMKMYSLSDICARGALEFGTKKNTWVERADTWVTAPQDLLSVSCFYLGKIEEGIKHCEEALKHHPNDVRIWKNYTAFLQEKTKRAAAKIEELQKKQ